MIRVLQYKLYPNREQTRYLDRWLGSCCQLYNKMLEHRIKAYKRRGESVSFYTQCGLLTQLRAGVDSVRSVPVVIARDALRRVDRGFKAFFRRIKAGQTPGFPRFRSRGRYNSFECLASGTYLQGTHVRVPGLGPIRCRGQALPEGAQKALRIIRRASGWYAQIVLDDGVPTPAALPVEEATAPIGIDMGLESFATLSTGEQIPNPRFARRSARKLRAHQRRVSRRKKGSKRRAKAVRRLARQHERVADQRRNFCHQLSTDLVRRFDLIAAENLNIKGMVRSRFGKSILDAAWNTFISQLAVKAAKAGRRFVVVNPRGTSQECPDCGRIKPKKLSERSHHCECGLKCHRDHAAARVVLSRVPGVAGTTRTWTDPAAAPPDIPAVQAGRKKRVALSSGIRN